MNNTSNILHFSKNFNVSFSLICMNQNQITQKSPTTMFITAQIKNTHYIQFGNINRQISDKKCT